MTDCIEVRWEGAMVEVSLVGRWSLWHCSNAFDVFLKKFPENLLFQDLVVRAEAVESWDSSIVVFLIKLKQFCEENHKSFLLKNIPEGIQRLLTLASVVAPQQRAVCDASRNTIIGKLDRFIGSFFLKLKNFISLTGEIFLGIHRFFTGKAKLRSQSFAVLLQDVGVKSLPMVALISFLVGLIIAFISILQLEKFGASIYVADLVGIAMMREMGCIMTGVIMSGLAGAAFAATIGTMMVNDEVDALETAGFSTVEFLVLPRMLAMMITMPMLCVCANFIGILGGMVASLTTTNISVQQFWTQTANAVFVNDFLVGMFKSVVFGLLISVTGCVKGMSCGRSAEDVGYVTTSAVVVSITGIIIADALFAVIFSIMGV